MDREDREVHLSPTAAAKHKDNTRGKPSPPRLTPARQKQKVQQQQAGDAAVNSSVLMCINVAV